MNLFFDTKLANKYTSLSQKIRVLEVVMADDIAVIEPVFSDQYGGKKVVITDQR